MKKIIIPALLLILFTSMASFAQLDGNWKGFFMKDNGDGDPFYVTLRLKTEGEKISGYLQTDFGNFDIIEGGTFDGKELQFTWLLTWVTADDQHGSLQIKHKGRLENDEIIIVPGDWTQSAKFTRGEWSMHRQ